MFKTILVPVDLGEAEAARPAIDKAVEIARGNPESSIRLIYVRPIVPVTYMEFMPPAFDEEQQADADRRLAELAAGIGDPYYPGYGNGGYDVRHYDIRVGWFPGRHRLIGDTTVTAVATQALGQHSTRLWPSPARPQHFSG